MLGHSQPSRRSPCRSKVEGMGQTPTKPDNIYSMNFRDRTLAKQWKIGETAEFQRNLIDKGFPVMDPNQRTEKSVARFKSE
jgi:hypothetical protein